MSEAKKFFICGICGNQVEMFEDGGGELICCGEPMLLMERSSEAAMDEAHELKVEEIPGGMRVTVGKNKPHMMSPGHFIQWIECWLGNHVIRKHLKPDEEPVAEFQIAEWVTEDEKPSFRAYCNIHGMRYCGCCGVDEPCASRESSASSGSCEKSASSCSKSSAV